MTAKQTFARKIWLTFPHWPGVIYYLSIIASCFIGDLWTIFGTIIFGLIITLLAEIILARLVLKMSISEWKEHPNILPKRIRIVIGVLLLGFVLGSVIYYTLWQYGEDVRMVIGVLLVAFFLTITILIIGYQQKCDKCGKWFAMHFFAKAYDRVLDTWDEDVSASIYYKTYRKCKYCFYMDYEKSSEIYKD
jgi:hypothetical protein